MRREMVAACAAGLVLLLAGCNPEDVHNLQSDTRKLGQDVAPVAAGMALQTKVGTRLALTKGVDMSGLHIDTRGTTVTVSGHVRDEGMHKRVITAINDTSGVEQVVDKLRVQQ